MYEHGTTGEELASVAVTAREWARSNPKAWRRDPITIEDVLRSDPICDPIKRLDACLITDGGGAVVVTTAERAARARKRAVDAGVADKVDIRVQDYRELGAERWDRISSIGMVEHVGAVNIDEYCRILLDAVEPGGTILNHGIARLRHGDPEAGAFSERFVFPDAAPLHLSRICAAFEKTRGTIDHVEGFPADYAETLRHWARRLDERLDEAVRLAGEERVRVWRLYLRAARRGFESGFTGIYQVRVRA
jgi:cyclopropane-fatty-acyl-phospholipid synthase